MGWRSKKSKKRFLSKECEDPVESGGILNQQQGGVMQTVQIDGGSLLAMAKGLAV